MKYLWGLSILFMLTQSNRTSAQITITQDDVMIVGTEIDMFYDTTGPDLNFAGTGTGQQWDFTGVTVSGQYESDIFGPAGAPREANFPTANAVLKRLGINVQFYENTSSELSFLGTVVTVLDTPIFNYNYTVLKYPAMMGQTFVDVGDRNQMLTTPLGFDPDGPTGPHPPVDSMTTFSVIHYESTIDAEGTVKTPEGEFEALRQLTTTQYIDSVFMAVNGKWEPISPLLSGFLMQVPVQIDTVTNYIWMAKGRSLPVMTIEFNPSNDKVIVAQWSTQDSVSVGINEQHSEVSSKVYPNPAKDVIHVLSQKEARTAELYDIQGRLLKTENLNRDRFIFSVAAVNPGTYVILIKDKAGKQLDSHAIQVVD